MFLRAVEEAGLSRSIGPVVVDTADVSCNKTTGGFGQRLTYGKGFGTMSIDANGTFAMRPLEGPDSGRRVGDPSACSERLIPDWIYENWEEAGIGDFDAEIASVTLAVGTQPELLVQRCGWAGSLRHELTQRHRFKSLMADNRPFNHLRWARVSGGRGGVLVNEERGLEVHLAGHVNDIVGNHTRLSLATQLARWPCVIDLEGTGFSARVPYLLHSGRVLIYAQRPLLTWYEAPPFPEPIRPWVHYVPTRADLADLFERVRWVLRNRDAAGRIAERAQRMARRHLTPPAARRFLLHAAMAATQSRSASSGSVAPPRHGRPPTSHDNDAAAAAAGSAQGPLGPLEPDTVSADGWATCRINVTQHVALGGHDHRSLCKCTIRCCGYVW